MTAGNKAWVHLNIPKYEIGYCQSTWPDQKLGMTPQCISKYIILVSQYGFPTEEMTNFFRHRTGKEHIGDYSWARPLLSQGDSFITFCVQIYPLHYLVSDDWSVWGEQKWWQAYTLCPIYMQSGRCVRDVLAEKVLPCESRCWSQLKFWIKKTTHCFVLEWFIWME